MVTFFYDDPKCFQERDRSLMKGKMTNGFDLPTIQKEQLDLIEQLTNAAGVSGAEGAVRQLVLSTANQFADEVQEDSLGNVIVRKVSQKNNALKLLLAAHMDEIGFMITVDEGDGLYQFEPVGGIDLRQLPGKAVLVGSKGVPGVIGARAIHLTTSAERKNSIPLNTLRIDVGPKARVEIGDRAVFATEFSHNGKTMFARALDDRLGVATLLTLMQKQFEHLDIYYVFTTQEEVGLRGARIAAFNIHPDIAIAVDATPANDFPAAGRENSTYNTRSGLGPAIYTMDRATISDPRLIAHFTAIAEQNKIPYQFRQAGGGGTDAGAMHLQHEGIPSISISVPLRGAHTAIGMVRIDDWQSLLRLLYAGLSELDFAVLQND